MIVQILLLIAGLALIVFGADWLVDGSSSLARRAGISEFVIGLTIVGFGTSCPELVVSLTGAIQGNSDISVGNVLGSNIVNTLLILGVTSLFYPVTMTRSNCKIDIPVCFGATLLFVLMGMNSSIFGSGDSDVLSRVEGIILLVVFALYLFYCFKAGKGIDEDSSSQKTVRVPIALLLIAAGLAGLIFGGRLFVDSAVSIARMTGVSDKFIAVTILAIGTSLPELATCIVAAIKRRGQLALGNILGSNVFNILLILGTSAIVTPLSLSSVTAVDIAALLMSTVLITLFAHTGKGQRLDRIEGIILLLSYASYMYWLIVKL